MLHRAKKMIEQTLKLIKDQTGITLELCDDFPGIYTHKKKKYFNVILNDARIYTSPTWRKLKEFSIKTKLISIEPNGVERVAIYPKQ